MTLCMIKITVALLSFILITFPVLANEIYYQDITKVRPIQLDADNLSTLISKISVLYGVTIMAPSAKLTKISTPSLNGEFTLDKLLEKLFQPTRFTYKKVSKNVYAIIPIKKLNSQKLAESPLEETYVQGKMHTGSHLWAAKNFVSPKTQSFDAEALTRNPSGLASERLQSWIVSNIGNSMNSAIGNGADSSTRLSLRGLPQHNTLILLNGERVAKWGEVSRSVNLNALPIFAAESVEVLPEGTSAIYGSDAVAGIVNVKLIEQYDGTKIFGSTGTSARGDADTNRITILTGKEGSSDDGNRFVLALHYENQKGLKSHERNISADLRNRGGPDLRSSATPNPRIYLLDGSVLIPIEGVNDQTPVEMRYRSATNEDLFDFNLYTTAVMPLEKKGAYFFGHINLSDHNSLTFSIDRSETNGTNTRAPQPLLSDTGYPNWNISSSTPYYPFTIEPKQVRRRLIEAGPRILEDNSTATNAKLQIQSRPAVSKNLFHWETIIWGSGTELQERLTNTVNKEKLNLAAGDINLCIEDKDCVPINLFGPPGSISREQLDYILSENQFTASNKIYGVSFKISSTQSLINERIPIHWLLGASIHREELEHIYYADQPDQDFQFSGDRTVDELFMEYIIPLELERQYLDSLDVKLSSRYAHYTTFPSRITPGFNLIYRPTSEWNFHYDASEGYSAPTLYDIYSTGVTRYMRAEDPCTLEEHINELSGCTTLADPSIKQFATVETGNTKLHPEESRHYAIGVSYAPNAWPDFEFNVFYSSTKIKNAITPVSAQEIINDSVFSSTDRKLPGEVTRDDQGNIAFIETSFINRGYKTVNAIDLKIKNELLVSDSTLAFFLDAAYLTHFSDGAFDNGKKNLVGTYYPHVKGGNGALPKWHIRTGAEYKDENFSVYYSLNYLSGTKEEIPFTNTTRKISNWLTHDISMVYGFPRWKNSSIIFGIENIFDQQAPLVTSSYNNAMDARSHNLKGRYFTLGISMQL